MNILPWHKGNWEELFTVTEKLPHALVLYGPCNSGIDIFTLEASKSLVCRNHNETEVYCNTCQDCNWFDSNSHPDIFFVGATRIDEDTSSNNISIDLIRELKVFFELTPHQQHGKKVAVIFDAHRMNLSSSNALLKILEEPPGESIIILTTSDLSKLLPTIKSRSRLISFSNPNLEEAKEYLGVANKQELLPFINLYAGNPLALLNDHLNYPLLAEIIHCLQQGKKFDSSNINPNWFVNGFPWLINLIQKWAYEILLSKLTHQQFYFPAEQSKIADLASMANISNLLRFQKKLNDLKLYASSPINKEINLDIIFIDYRKIFI